MYKKLVVITFLLMSVLVYSEGSEGSNVQGKKYSFDAGTDVNFTSSTVDFITYDQGANTYSFSITYNKIEKFDYITFNEDVNVPKRDIKIKKGKYLVLASNDFLFVYSGNDMSPVLVISPRSLWHAGADSYKLNVTSALTERSVVYNELYFYKYWLGKPWCEGLKDSGIGESITLTYNPQKRENSEQINLLSFVLINGFVSYGKYDLYNKNNRIKRLKIMSDNSVEQIIELSDTPHPQFFTVPVYGNRITFTILDVYSGSKYNDTCLSLLAPLP